MDFKELGTRIAMDHTSASERLRDEVKRQQARLNELGEAHLGGIHPAVVRSAERNPVDPGRAARHQPNLPHDAHACARSWAAQDVRGRVRSHPHHGRTRQRILITQPNHPRSTHMISLTIIQNGAVVYRSSTIRSSRAARAALRAYIAKVGRRTARHAQVRLSGPHTNRSCRMSSTLAYRAAPKAA